MHMAIRNKKGHQAGFTLVELVITIVLVGILAGLAALIILQGVRAYADEQSRSDLHYQARLAMERMAREIRLIRSCGDITPPASNPAASITFTDISGTSVNFALAGNNLNRGADLLATGITSAQPFRFLAADGTTTTIACPGIWFVEITVADTQRTESVQMRTRVHPRSL
jgi:prepilin-type N-terminal cleavage/methylation domain-containing protein